MNSRSPIIACLVLAALPLAAFAEVKDSPLADAAMNRDIAAVRSLLAKKADVNAPGADGTTALEWVIRIDDVDTAKLLLAAGADPKKPNRLGVTPVALASANGNTEMLRLLLDAGVDANSMDPNGEPASWSAIRSGVVDALKILLDRGARVEFKDSVQQTTQFRGSKSDEALKLRILELAAQFDIPVTEDQVALHTLEHHTTVDCDYTRVIEVAPGFKYPWSFNFHIDTLSDIL